MGIKFSFKYDPSFDNFMDVVKAELKQTFEKNEIVYREGSQFEKVWIGAKYLESRCKTQNTTYKIIIDNVPHNGDGIYIGFTTSKGTRYFWNLFVKEGLK